LAKDFIHFRWKLAHEERSEDVAERPKSERRDLL
jgi:hypothetical protein